MFTYPCAFIPGLMLQVFDRLSKKV